MSELLFSSDLHFGHKFMTRLRAEGEHGHQAAFPDRDLFAPHVESDILAATAMMDEIMIGDWNDSVGHNDEVWFLGDLSFYKEEETRKIFHRLHGRKHLIRGNHDPKWVERLPWVEVYDFKRVKYNGHSMYLMHYPMLTWPNAHKGTWHLHGHSHGNLRAPESTRLDVGPDSTGQIVISAEEIVEIMSHRTYDFIDHHEE